MVKQAKVAEFLGGKEDQRPHAVVTIRGIEVKGLFDSGATISCLGRSALETLHRCNQTWKEVNGGMIRTASDQPLPIIGHADVDVTFRKTTKRIRLFIIPTLSNELYLGIDFWLAFDLLPRLEEITTNQTQEDERDEEETPLHELDAQQSRELQKIIDLFPSCEKEGLGRTTLIQHTINVGSAKPTKQRYYAVSPAVEAKMYAEVDRMLELGVVEPSTSAWNSPFTCVSKPNGKTRLCLDARLLNSVSVKDAYPMPLIDSILSRLNETRYIWSIDLKDAFWQVELDDMSREKTAFTVPGRPLYQFRRMAFGLCGASQTMCRVMDAAIPPELRGQVFVYIDDLLIVAADFETHLQRLEIVAKSLRKANLTINVEKSKFCMKSIRYFGHIVGNGEIKPDPGRVKCIVDYTRPNSPKEIRRFLGMTGWYQRYINNYASLASPLTDLLKKTDRFKWNPEAQHAFDTLKDSLTTAPVLTHPNFAEPFLIQCDASMTGVGSVLFQLEQEAEHCSKEL